MSRSTKIQKSQFQHSAFFADKMKKRNEISKEIKSLMLKKDKLLSGSFESNSNNDLNLDDIDAKMIKLSFYLRRTSAYSECRRIKVCAKTGRSRGVIRKIGMSRHVFRHYASNGMLMGLKKV